MISLLDWIIIILYIIFALGIGYYFTRKKNIDTGDYFLSGRRLPWYIAGTGMVATTFAADTPLAVTELVAEHGIAGNWLWWNMVFGGVLTVFFFSKLWRRANIFTDCEFVTIRYSGKAAHFLRGFRAVYIGLFMNLLVISWVNLAMVKIVGVFFPQLTIFGYESFQFAGFQLLPQHIIVAAIMFFVAIYSSFGGLSGVSFVDTFQFFLSMGACVVLAIFAVNHESIGGISGLKEQLPDFAFKFLPVIGETQDSSGIISMGWLTFLVFFGMQWWASWYPGAEPGGGGYVAQRMMSAKNENHAIGATLWFQIAHYAIRPWPWIIVALVSLVMYPGLSAAESGNGFIMVIRDILPSGLVGLLLAAFLAAYMSTIASQIVWGSSYIVNDLLKPYVQKNKTEKQYVNASRWFTILLLITSLLLTTKIERISDVWKFMLEYSAGIGIVLILRWYWWRINAWSEIAAILAPFAMYPIVSYYDIKFPITLPLILAWSTIVWIIVTFCTKPTDLALLKDFYSNIRPAGPGWKKIAKTMPHVIPDKGYPLLFVAWISGCIMILSFLFGTGKLIFGYHVQAILFFIATIFFAFIVYKIILATNQKTKDEQAN
jgi:solute:Na+ symporter, SSS family